MVLLLLKYTICWVCFCFAFSFKEYGGGMVLHPNKGCPLQEPKFKMGSDSLSRVIASDLKMFIMVEVSLQSDSMKRLCLPLQCIGQYG